MSFAKESIRTLFVRIIIIMLNLICGILNARYLGATGLGVFTLLSMIPTLCFRFGNLGIGSSLSFFVAQKRLSPKQAIRFMWGAGVVLSIACCYIMLLIRDFSYLPWHDLPIQLYYFSLALIPLIFMQNFLTRIVAGKLQIIDLNIADFIGAITYLLALILFVIHLNLNTLGAIFALITNRGTVFFILLFRLPGKKGTIKSTKEKQIDKRTFTFHKIWGYGKWNYLIMLNRYLLDQIPVFFLKFVTNNETVGLFFVAKGMQGKIQIIPDTFAAILFPFNAASDEAQAIQRTNRATRCFFSLMIIFTVLLVVTIKHLILLVYGVDFIDSVSIFYALSPLIICFPLYKLQNVHIAATGKSKQASFISMAALPVCIGLTILLVPSYGALGASTAISSTYFLLFLLSIFFYKKITKSTISDILLLNHADINLIRETISMKRKTCN